MSRQTLSSKFSCDEDCRQEGCPGHEMVVTKHNTSNTVTVEIDGNRAICWDWARMDQLTKIWGALRP